MKNITDPHAVIEELRGQAAVMGFNDSEMQAFDRVIEEFEAKKIGVEEAFRKAQAIIEGKQDYH